MKAVYADMREENDSETGGGDDLKVYRIRSKSPLIVIATLSALLFLATILFIVFVSLYASSSSSSSSSPGSDVCQTEACFDLSVQIKGAMDETVDPCDDFYNYTCGNWQFFNQITDVTGALTKQQSDVYNDLSEVLKGDFTGGNAILTELSDYYESCLTAKLMNESEFEETLLPVIKQIYQDLGGWSLVGIPGDGTQWSINSSQFIGQKRLGGQAFYSISPDFNTDNGYRGLLIEQSGLTLPQQAYSLNSSYSVLLSLVGTLLNELAQQPVSNDSIAAIVDFEFSLAQIWQITLNDSIYTVQELYELWPYHDWLNVLHRIFQPSGVTILLSSEVKLGAPDYFRRLTTLVESTPIEVLENYAKWSITFQAIQIFSGLSSIRESLTNMRQTIMGEPTMDQLQECVQMVNQAFPIALGRVYAQNVLPSTYRETVVKLVAEVREGLRQRMMDVDWLDSQTRELALEKLAAIESRVAYPARTFDDNYLDSLYGEYDFDKSKFVDNYFQYLEFSFRQQLATVYTLLDRDMWFSSPVTVNAYYIKYFNQISILEGIMRIPSFSTDWPLSMQYGALGAIIGHELTHGFDNNGRQYDKDGKKRMWWSQSAVDAFNDRAQCFVDQYSQYELYGYNVNGTQTLGENIADNGGIRSSFEGFKKVAGKSQSLPGLANFTDQQLFFLAFSQVWCSTYTPSTFLNTVMRDVHAPGPFRVIGTLSNYEAFAEAFNCPSDSPMNPSDKCVLW